MHSSSRIGVGYNVNWGYGGVPQHYRARLREVTDTAFRKGEHAS
jgi:hypothetical protein